MKSEGNKGDNLDKRTTKTTRKRVHFLRTRMANPEIFQVVFIVNMEISFI